MELPSANSRFPWTQNPHLALQFWEEFEFGVANHPASGGDSTDCIHDDSTAASPQPNSYLGELQHMLRGASHYGLPNLEAMEVSGQTLLRVQRNGLKIGNKIFIFKHSAGHSVKPSKAESKVRTFGNGVSRPLKLDGHSVKPPKAKSKVQTHIIYRTSIHFFFNNAPNF